MDRSARKKFKNSPPAAGGFFAGGFRREVLAEIPALHYALRS